MGVTRSNRRLCSVENQVWEPGCRRLMWDGVLMNIPALVM
jgi:hypothetical protein